MESENSEKPDENFLKIDTVWSEAEENLTVKEEIVSDLECYASEDEICDSEVETKQNDKDDNSSNNNVFGSSNENHEALNEYKEKKSTEKRSNSNENLKLNCSHDSKNYKVVRRRLRCGDCNSLICPECYKVLVSTFQTHLAGCDLNKMEFHSCKVCNLAFHSLCALQAHVRIHTKSAPYVCPDCGLLYNNVNFLILHLIRKCCHVYKVLKHKCKCQPGIYFSPKAFKEHIQKNHIESRIRCSYCSSLFTNIEEFKHHMNKVHQMLKIQFIRYFLCSLCSNMLVSKYTYGKHITRHCESYDSYEINYQCVCGYIYSRVGLFRLHNQECSKVGNLPPHWAFLQKKIIPHEVPQFKSFESKEDPAFQSPSIQALNLFKPFKKINVGKKNSKNASSLLCDLQPLKDTPTSLKKLTNFEPSNSEILYQTSAETEISNGINNFDSSQIQSFECPEIKLQTSDIIQEGNKTNSLQDTQYVDDCKLLETNTSNTKYYNHIPCDHLGYLSKTKTSEDTCKEAQPMEIVDLEPPSETFNYVSELDEKTGLLNTKKIPIKGLTELNCEDNNCEKNVEKAEKEPVLNSDIKTPKLKLQPVVSCPFCVVKFQKKRTIFQQFRLHMESYHSDSALNIFVNNNDENDKVEKNFCTSPNSKVADEDSQSEKMQAKLKDCYVVLGEKIKSPFTKTSESESSKKEFLEQKNNLNNDEEKSHEKRISIKKKSCDFSINNSSYESNQKLNDSNDTKNMCWTVEFSLQKDKNESSTPKQKTSLLSINNEQTSEKESLLKNEEKLKKFISQEKKLLKKSNNESTKRLGFKGNVQEADTNKNVENNTESNFNEGDEKPGKALTELNEENENNVEPQLKKLIKIEVDLDEDCESNSNNLNWCFDNSKSDESRNEEQQEKERTRRESEVWSEFYESLKLAEENKKKKTRKEINTSKEGKKPTISNYSNKRRVKKPKRFRESSESDGSGIDFENSESDPDYVLSHYIATKTKEKEEGTAIDTDEKKQIILNKMKNVDDKMIDYLFYLISKREKYMELRYKNSNKYSQDLQTYRKKILNGIRQRGRPHKILRYQDALKKKETFGGVSILKELPDSQKLSLNTLERKRGRPRKIIDPSKVKERRRSDKEVDFIEKNFERDESESSPSKRKRKLSSKLQYYKNINLIDEKDEFSSGQVITNKQEINKSYCCAFCKGIFSDSTEFREHILGHRVEENSYQCMECGECFVVRPSLEKHLHAFHKIKNTDKYILENQCCNANEETAEENNEPLKENQCKVCKDQFDRAIDLTKHFRIHGMAFLKEFRKTGKAK